MSWSFFNTQGPHEKSLPEIHTYLSRGSSSRSTVRVARLYVHDARASTTRSKHLQWRNAHRLFPLTLTFGAVWKVFVTPVLLHAASFTGLHGSWPLALLGER